MPGAATIPVFRTCPSESTHRAVPWHRRSSSALALSYFALLALLAQVARAEEPLALAVPDDALLCVSWRAGEVGFVDGRLEPFRGALAQADLLGAITSRLRGERDGEDAARFDVLAAYWERTLTAVDWWSLLRREFVLAVRSTELRRLEFLIVSRVGDEALDGTLIALRGVLHGLAGAIEGYEFIETLRDGRPTTVMYRVEDPSEQICLGGRRGAVFIATSSQLLRSSLELHAGTSSRGPLGLAPAYRSSLASLAPPERVGNEGRFEIYYRPGEAFEGVEGLDVLERYHFVADFRSDRIDWKSRLGVAGTPNALADSFVDQEPIGAWLRRVPSDALSFSVSAGAHPVHYQEWCVELLRSIGGLGLADALRDARIAGVELRDDILARLTGRRIELRFRSGTAWLCEANGEPAAEALAGTLREALEASRDREGAALSLSEIRVAERDAVRVVSPFFLGAQPVVGVVDGFLVFATSSEAWAAAVVPPHPGSSVVDDRELGALWTSHADLREASAGELGADIAELRDLLRAVGLVGRLLGGDVPAAAWVGLLPRLRAPLETLSFLGRRVSTRTGDGREGVGYGTILVRERQDL